MHILYYNWVDYLDPEKRGGGVTVYQRNLIEDLKARPDIRTDFLSSGITYDLTSQKPRWQVIGEEGPGECRRFEIVNSGALAPSHHSFGASTQLHHEETTRTFRDFLHQNGPYDIVHFNNLEGIPAEILKLKEEFQDTKFVLSLHNYYPFCPQVNLWHREAKACENFDEGRKCAYCLLGQANPKAVRYANAVSAKLKRHGIQPGTPAFDGFFFPLMRIGYRTSKLLSRISGVKRPQGSDNPAEPREQSPTDNPRVAAVLESIEPPSSQGFDLRRREMVDLINAYCDSVIGVSRRVTRIASNFGIKDTLLKTMYIGTQHADRFLNTDPNFELPRADGTLSLAFLGYARRDKGFYFLLESLEELPKELAARIHLIIAAANTDKPTLARVSGLAERFASIRFADGYSHDNLDEILRDADVGVVPVLWEDSLPQVAIEMHARRLPLLTSNLGGARELANSDKLVFQSGSVSSFHDTVEALLGGDIDLQTYWQEAMPPKQVGEHVDELLNLYGEVS
ncbi:glycosyltransferase [Shimia abyssi]|uniref:Glycosyl transferase family 1 n=1 Tax=Shimia abyssi TaxID=1662395 RepID=A0A2P8F7C8_9RHOB|nr:glycosyltransferase [Shimia abyssi]PSL17621.1 glycosyl transferase family 1 [Shimia abyssi]